jgi:hypothetical protein
MLIENEVATLRVQRFAHAIPMPDERRLPVTFKTVLIAMAAVTALIGAALLAVPSAGDGLHPCLDLPRCLGY